ncbi:LuxR C-terminal-related transcriptional regulator [Mycobacterium sp. ACS4331]|uniref:LuxR C-terminal-related transcriptional regulator n=1 Tax=Mycobacterium sp. ACS4331 TaxID=1834121 RepID=UPI0007FC4FCA|nr:LuxR C-terminal-related transcriptional regulator [Mycobacterium sp. ACS4331]OBF28060.1 LuxR family transcriptional regulator [Mycobacterium sp. ACS4331]
MVAGDWQPCIAAVTAGRPGVPAGSVRRTGVLAKLSASRDGDLVVVTAPAGYGKTTVTVQWDESDDRVFAWVPADTVDHGYVHLLRHIESLAQAGTRVVVIDDVHTLTSTRAVAALQALVDTPPASLIVVLVGRAAPLLHLARRRLSGSVVEVGAQDLAMSDREATETFVGVAGPCDAAMLATVLDRCEGWPAGIALVGMATRGGADPVTVTGCDALVADYLVEEVLGSLDGESVDFMIESSILERFSASALDEVLDRVDSARRLEAIRVAGHPLLVPLDRERAWYRWHRLLADLLRARVLARDPVRYRDLARRACRFLTEQGDIDGAVRQSLAAQDRAHAAALVGRDAIRLGFDGHTAILARRIGLLDERTVAEYPDAAIASAWLGVLQGDAELIQRSLQSAVRADRGQPMSDGTPSVSVAVALVGSLVGVSGVHAVLRHAETVRSACEDIGNPWWGAATVMKGAAEAMLGHSAAARELLESALPTLAELPGFEAAALAHLALLDLGDGDDIGCVERSAAARRIADTHDLGDVVPMVVVYATSAVTAARVGDVGAAREAVVITERLLARLGSLSARTALLGHGLLAWTGAVIGDRDTMLRHLAEGDRALRREPGALGLSRRLDRVRALASRGRRQPLTAAELRLLPHLATHLSLQHIADELTIGRETVKSQATSIYRKLDVASRGEAVAEARRTGLLSG